MIMICCVLVFCIIILCGCGENGGKIDFLKIRKKKAQKCTKRRAIYSKMQDLWQTKARKGAKEEKCRRFCGAGEIWAGQRGGFGMVFAQ